MKKLRPLPIMRAKPKKAKPVKEAKQKIEPIKMVKKETAIEDKINNQIKKLDHTYDEAATIMSKIELALERNTKETFKSLKKFESSIDKYEKAVEANTAIIAMAEETLRNVLVAIQQNEYLQAWYPEQSGFPAMKVIGKHPSKIKKGAHVSNPKK